jgi:predicted  nucleic acid-binding Zn-ribbon protein
VKDDILNLIILQSLDDKIRLWRRTATEGPARVSQARERLTALETELGGLKSSLAEKRKRLKELETETADLTERRKTNQSRLLRARNNDEYRAILKEGETIATMISARDDEGLALMDSADAIEGKLGGVEADALAEMAEFESRLAAIEAVLADGRENEAKAEAEREELLKKIPQQLLSRYNTVAQNRAGQAMGPVKTGQCQACQLSIPPQIFNELQRCDKLMICPNCARIMYWTAHPHFREFLGEDAVEPQPQPEKPEGRRGRKPKAKPAPEEPAATSTAVAAEEGPGFEAESDLSTPDDAAAQG